MTRWRWMPCGGARKEERKEKGKAKAKVRAKETEKEKESGMEAMVLCRVGVLEERKMGKEKVESIKRK